MRLDFHIGNNDKDLYSRPQYGPTISMLFVLLTGSVFIQSAFGQNSPRDLIEFPSLRTEKTSQIGAWWFLGREDLQTPINGENDFVSRGVGLDWSLPISDRLTLRGEGWYGKNLSDWRGGIAQGVNSTTGEEIESCGG